MQEQLKALTLIGGMSLALLTADLYAAEKASTITATHGVAAGGDIRDNEIIINQYSLDQLRQMIKEEVQGGTSDKADKLSLELAVNKQALLGFFKILKQENVPPEKLSETLAEIAHRHKALLERLAIFNPEDPALKKLIEQARIAIDISDYDQADQLLEKVETAEMDAVHKAEKLAIDAQSKANQKRLKVAAVRAKRGGLSLTQLDYRQAAKHFKEASKIVPASDNKQRNQYLENYASALYRQGTERVDSRALQEAIEAYHEILKGSPREQLPQDWAMTQNNLDNALAELGKLENMQNISNKQ